MFKIMADNGIDISAKQDGALYNVALNDQDFIIKGLGDEFAMSYVGLNVSVESGECVIHGRHITSEETNTITLPANESGYLVLRVDLTKPVGQEALLFATPTLTHEEINWNGTIYDMPIATFRTGTIEVQQLEDVRVIKNNVSVEKYKPIIKVISPISQTITCTNGTIVYTKTGIEVEFEVDYGTWTIRDEIATKEVVVDAVKTYYVEMQTILGIRRSLTASSTSWERTDSAICLNATASIGTSAGYSDFDNYYPFSEIKRETLPTGDVMVKIPKFFYRRFRDENYEYIKIADNKGNNFKLHPAFDRPDGVRNFIYVGAYKTSSNNKSVSGALPQVNQTRATTRNNARSKGAGYGIIDIATLNAIQMLMLVEVANNNVQEVIGGGWTASGHTDAINTGSCDSVPNLTGRPAGTSNNVDVVWRGIEGFWGNVWEWVDGININNGTYYICTDQTKYADDTTTNYTSLEYTGGTAWSNSYIQQEGYDEEIDWCMIPTTAGGGSATTYYADACWSASGWRVYRHGGDWDTGLGCGLFATYLGNSSSVMGGAFGSRLLYIPID